MSDLFWPGSERAGSVMSDAALLDALVQVEAAWLDVLVAGRVAPDEAADSLAGLIAAADLATISVTSEAGGNPAIPLLDLLRSRLSERNPEAARWLHRGLTSQDVMDSALMRCTVTALDHVLVSVREQVCTLCAMVETHRGTLMAGRTLTQYAVPVTFGLKAAGWLTGVLDAAEDLLRVRAAVPIQLGGAAGTAAAATELAAIAGSAGPASTAVRLAESFAQRLGLAARTPWHTSRHPITAVGDAMVSATDAWGHIANDVVALGRPEVGELSEAHGGGSSTMPHKQNPVLSVLIRRAALSAPALAAQLHLAAAGSVDERPNGEWHSEWAALRALSRNTVIAASQTTDLLAGLRVHADIMQKRVNSTLAALLAEQASLRGAVGADGLTEPAARDYLGASELFVSDVLDRAGRLLKELP